MTTEVDLAFDLRFLEPEQVRVFRTDGDARVRLTIDGDRSYVAVRIARAFPFTDPSHYVGFRDTHDKDIGLVVDETKLDDASRKLIAEELERRYFTPKVTKVISVKEEHGAVMWQLETDRGPRRFVVRNIRDNSVPMGPDRLILTDPEGNRMEFTQVSQYGPKAYDVLSKVM